MRSSNSEFAGIDKMEIRKATDKEMLSLWGHKDMDSVPPTTLFFAQNISSENAEFWTLNDNGQIIGELYIFCGFPRNRATGNMIAFTF